MAENKSDTGLDAVVDVADVADVVELVDEELLLSVVLEVVDCCCNPISTPRIMLERLGVVLPVRPPSVAVVAVVLDVVEVELVVDVLDVVSSFVSRLARIWDSPDPLELMPAMDMVKSPLTAACDVRSGTLSKALHVPILALKNGGIRRHAIVRLTVMRQNMNILPHWETFAGQP